MTADASVHSSPAPFTARELLQAWLDLMSSAILDGDLPMLQAHINLPYKRQTLDAEYLTETPIQLEEDASRVTQSLRSLGVNHFIRIAGDAEFLSDDYIEGFYVTHTLRNSTPVLPTFNSKAVLRRFGLTWKLVEVHNEYSNRRWPAASISVPEYPIEAYKSSSSDVRREAGQPGSLYQSVLDRMDATTNARDFDGFSGLCHFPLSLHSEAWDLEAKTSQDIRPWFGSVLKYLEISSNMKVVRRVREAEFVGPQTLCGYHDTCFDADGEDGPAPIRTRMILTRIRADWFVKSIAMAIANTNYKAGDPIRLGDLVQANDINKRTRQ